MKRFLLWFTYKENILVCLLAALMLTMHLVYLDEPPTLNTSADPPTRNYLGDETFYVTEANRFLNGDLMERPEHPPVGKWLIALSIHFFGDNSAGWRVFSVIFAMISIFLFYFICRRIVRKDTSATESELNYLPGGWWRSWLRPYIFVPVLATFLFISENMSFLMGHIAMLDVFCITFMLLGFLLYLRGNYLLCGIALGLSMLCKAMALLGVLGLAIHIIAARQSDIKFELKFLWNRLKMRFYYPTSQSDLLKTLLIPLTVCLTWFVLLPLLQYPAGHTWISPIKSTWDMLTTHMSLNEANYGSPSGIASNPWMWIIWPDGIYYWYTPRYLLAIGWTVWVMIIPSMAYLVFEVIRFRKTAHELAWWVLSWFAGVYVLLVVLKFTTGRLMYHFYFYPAIPAVCLGTAWLIWKLWGVCKRKGKKSRIAFTIGVSIYLVGTIVTFVFMSPLGTNLINLPT